GYCRRDLESDRPRSALGYARPARWLLAIPAVGTEEGGAQHPKLAADVAQTDSRLGGRPPSPDRKLADHGGWSDRERAGGKLVGRECRSSERTTRLLQRLIARAAAGQQAGCAKSETATSAQRRAGFALGPGVSASHRHLAKEEFRPHRRNGRRDLGHD